MQKKENLLIRFLYNSCFGRIILKILINERISKYAGVILNSRISRLLIPLYIKKHKIDMKEYPRCEYNSFNDFFTREKTSVGIDLAPYNLISPCDGYLSIYKISANSRYRIKNISYSLCELLKNEELAEKYKNGLCFIFRLAPDNYHRYHYIDDGVKSCNYSIKGVLHCVRPIACAKYPVYIQNSREYTILNTVHFGDVIQIEVGALLVGKIHNNQNDGMFCKGEEKGYFEFGGSTIILLFEENTVITDNKILVYTLDGKEAKVKAGDKIGYGIRRAYE